MLAKPVAPPFHRNCFIVTLDVNFIIQCILVTSELLMHFAKETLYETISQVAGIGK